jgi:hypothetical protein
MMFEPGGGGQEQDQDNHEPLLGGREDKEIEEALHFAA